MNAQHVWVMGIIMAAFVGLYIILWTLVSSWQEKRRARRHRKGFKVQLSIQSTDSIIILQGDNMNIKTSDSGVFALVFPTQGQDAKGRPAPIEGPRVAISDPNLATSEVDPNNPQRIILRATGNDIGLVQITPQADNTIGEGEELISAEVINWTIEPGKAVGFSVTVEAPSVP